MDATRVTVSEVIALQKEITGAVRIAVFNASDRIYWRISSWAVNRLYHPIIKPAMILASQTTTGTIFLSLNSDVYLRSNVRCLILSNVTPTEEEQNILYEAIRAAEFHITRYRSTTLEKISHSPSFAALLSPPTDIYALETQSAKWKSILSPIRQLPPEILQHIFVLGLPHRESYEGNHGRFWPWRLSRVCRMWRGVSLSTPVLWTYIPRLTLYDKDYRSKNRTMEYQRAAFMLRHAQTAPLHIIIDKQRSSTLLDYASDINGGSPAPITDLHPAVSLLIRHSKQWETVHISLKGFELLSELRSIKGRVPLLRSLHLSLLQHEMAPGTARVWDMFSIAPNLEEVTLAVIARQDQFLLPRVQLRHLNARIGNMFEIDQQYLNWSIRSLKTLQTLELHYPDPMNQLLLGSLPNPLPPLFNLTRLHLNSPIPSLLMRLTLPCLEDLKLVRPDRWSPTFLTACLSLLQRSSAASLSESIPLQKLYIHSIIHDLYPYPSESVLSVFQLSGHSIRFLCIPIPDSKLLHRLANASTGPDTILPSLEVCIFIVSDLRMKWEDCYAMNLFAVARCEHSLNSISTTTTPSKSLKSLALYTPILGTDLTYCHSALESCCIWKNYEPYYIYHHKHSNHCSLPTTPSTTFTPTPVRGFSPGFALLQTLKDLVNTRTNGRQSQEALAGTTYIKACSRQWYTEEQTQNLIRQLESLRLDEGFDVNTDSFPDLYCLMCEVKKKLDCTPFDTVKSRFPYFVNLDRIVYTTLQRWYDLIQEELKNVHWISYPNKAKLFFIPSHEPIRSTEDAIAFVGCVKPGRSPIYGKRDVVMRRYDIKWDSKSY